MTIYKILKMEGKNMEETKGKKEEMDREFDHIDDANHISGKLTNHNYALRAFGALLGSSDLRYFADQDSKEPDDFEAANLRWGLEQIIDLYLSHQENILKEYVNKYNKSDYALVRSAKNSIDMFEHGAWRSVGKAIDSLKETVKELDVVIKRGGMLKREAEEFKNICTKYIETEHA